MLNFVSADILKKFHIFPRKHFMQTVSKCQMFIGKNKRIINMLSAEKAERVLIINFEQMTSLKFSYFFSQETGFNISCTLSPIETVCMTCQILLAGKT